MRRTWVWRSQRAECYRLNCTPPNVYTEIPTHNRPKMWLYLETRLLENYLSYSEVSRVALIHMMGLLKRRKSGDRHTHEEREDRVKIKGDDPLPAKERDLRRNKPRTFLADLQHPGLWDDAFLMMKPHPTHNLRRKCFQQVTATSFCLWLVEILWF